MSRYVLERVPDRRQPGRPRRKQVAEPHGSRIPAVGPEGVGTVRRRENLPPTWSSLEAAGSDTFDRCEDADSDNRTPTQAASPLDSYYRSVGLRAPYAERQLVKSRERVRSYGEVFTPRSMVDQMLDLVRDDLETGEGFVDKTFLEPAAGDGNFLVAILQRKLAAIETNVDPSGWERESLFALASIYAIELLEDNHRDAQAALLAEFVAFHASHGTPCSPRTDLYRAAVFLISTNILRGNTLTGKTPDGDVIEFSWWTRQSDDPSLVRREPFTFNSLREDGAFDFTVYASYQPCPVHHVHKKANANA